MAQNSFTKSISLNQDVLIEYKKLEKLTEYYKERGVRELGSVSYWFRKWLSENVDKEIEKAERKFGESIGIDDKVTIQKLHNEGKSVIDELKNEAIDDVFGDE